MYHTVEISTKPYLKNKKKELSQKKKEKDTSFSLSPPRPI
jgi:hypothetical protein